MTRKRFIKLVMAYEIQRNDAEQLAKEVEDFGSYEALFESKFLYFTTRKLLKSIARQWKIFGNLFDWG